MPTFLSNVNLTGVPVAPTATTGTSTTQIATTAFVASQITAVPNELVVATTQPVDPLVEYWINPAAVGGGTVSDYVPIVGGTVTGTLTIRGDTRSAWLSASLGADMNGYVISNVGVPVNPNDAANRTWVESRNPPMLVLGPVDPVPPGTVSGTVIVRTT